jgi:hypothetical protein
VKIHVLMAQRKCDYPGQYAPEALACMSRAEFDDNPRHLRDMRQENLETGEFDAAEIVTLEVDGDAIEQRLFPSQEPIAASVAPAEQG